MRCLLASLVGLFALTVDGPCAAAEPTPWKAGAASVKITPEGPMAMAGYAGRKRPSEGVAQDLFAKALAIEGPGATRVVIVTLDLIGVSKPLRDWVAARLREKHGLEPGALLMGASHTHCGPQLGARPASPAGTPAPATPPPSYLETLQPKIVTEAGGAMAYTSFPGPLAESVEERIIAQVLKMAQATQPPRPYGARSAPEWPRIS